MNIDKRKNKDYNKDIQKIFNLLSIRGNYTVIGSASLKNIEYADDYDLMEFFKEDCLNKDKLLNNIYKLFKNKFIEAKKNKNIFITDFKCGEINNEPIRWNYKNMLKGFKLINNEKIFFTDCLLMKSTIKLDMIVLINGIFNEFSENYYLNLNGNTNYKEEDLKPKNIINSIEEDIKELLKDNNYWKSLKRTFSLLKIKNYKNKNVINKLINFFNSNIGLLNKNKNELGIIENLLNSDNKPNIDDIKNNLQIVKNSLSNIYVVDLKNISLVIDRITELKSKKSILSKIKLLKKNLENIINKESLKFINENKDIKKLLV